MGLTNAIRDRAGFYRITNVNIKSNNYSDTVLINPGFETDSAYTQVARNVTESAKGLSEVSSTIAAVSSAVSDTTRNITHIKSSTNELANLSEKLKGLIAQFKI